MQVISPHVILLNVPKIPNLNTTFCIGKVRSTMKWLMSPQASVHGYPSYPTPGNSPPHLPSPRLRHKSQSISQSDLNFFFLRQAAIIPRIELWH